jgi:hypothetical protein
MLNRTGKWSAGLQIVPETNMNGKIGYNCSFGLFFGGTGGTENPHAWHTGISFGQNSIAKDGVGIVMQGGTSSDDDPKYAMQFYGDFNEGIDFTNLVLNGPSASAITMSPYQRVSWLGGVGMWADQNYQLNVNSHLRVGGNISTGALYLGTGQGLLYDAGAGNVYFRTGISGNEKYFGFLADGNFRQASATPPEHWDSPGVYNEVVFQGRTLFMHDGQRWRRMVLPEDKW